MGSLYDGRKDGKAWGGGCHRQGRESLAFSGSSGPGRGEVVPTPGWCPGYSLWHLFLPCIMSAHLLANPSSWGSSPAATPHHC